MSVTARPTIQPISERFRLVAIQMRLEEKIFVLVTCVIGRSPLCELLHSTPTVRIDSFTAMRSAKQLPTEHFDDYSFVFN